MPTPLNIILIDDHPLLRMGVAGYIEPFDAAAFVEALFE